MIFLDWSQYGALGWTEACPGEDLSDLIGGWSGSKVVELQTLYPIRREERTLYCQCVGLANRGFAQWLSVLNSKYQPPNLELLVIPWPLPPLLSSPSPFLPPSPPLVPPLALLVLFLAN